METMEEYKLVRILNEEPEFCEGMSQDINANFFILCEEGNCLFGSNVYDLQIAGMSVLNWVVRACSSQPKILKVKPNENILETIRNYVDFDAEYSVIFYANTPMINKSHIFDLLEFVQRKQMNVCKLKRGFVFKNEFIRDNDEFYSVDEYDFASNDFFEIKNYEDFEEAKNCLTKKVLDFHKNYGIYFENEQTINIDANTEIGKLSKLASNVSFLNGSILGENCVVNKNSTITGSKIGDNVKIGMNVTIINSIVKDNTKIGDGVYIKDSIIGIDVSVENNSNITSSSVKDGTILKQNCEISEARIGENCVIGKYSKIIGLTDKTSIGSGSDIGACSEILDCNLAKEQTLDENTKIKGKVIR